MPRPVKCRRVCHIPENADFLPACGAEGKPPVILTIDEYEVIRLIDREGFSQEQCSKFMQIARTTVQKIYENARKKIACVLVEGLPLRIQGGEIWLCDGQNPGCPKKGCRKWNQQQFSSDQYKKEKGDTIMRIAVTYENGQIFQHFGHTEQFKVYDVSDGKITASQVVSTNGSGHGALAGVLNALNADVLICGGIGGGAQAALAAAGIRLCGGVSGDADQAVEAFLSGTLDYDPDVHCSHHDQEHSGSHTCGDHGCAGHRC